MMFVNRMIKNSEITLEKKDLIVTGDIPTGVRISLQDGSLTVNGNIEKDVRINVARMPVLTIEHNTAIFTVHYVMLPPNISRRAFNVSLIGDGSKKGNTWTIGCNSIDMMGQGSSIESTTAITIEPTRVFLKSEEFCLSENTREPLQLTFTRLENEEGVLIVAGSKKFFIPIPPVQPEEKLKGNVTITGNVSDMAHIRADGLVMINNKRKHVLKPKEFIVFSPVYDNYLRQALKPSREPSKAVELNKQDLALRNPFILSEIENAFNLPTQTQIQQNAEEFGMPLQFPDVGRLPADIRLSEGIKTQKPPENTVQNEGFPEHEDIIKRKKTLKTSSFSSLR